MELAHGDPARRPEGPKVIAQEMKRPVMSRLDRRKSILEAMEGGAERDLDLGPDLDLERDLEKDLERDAVERQRDESRNGI